MVGPDHCDGVLVTTAIWADMQIGQGEGICHLHIKEKARSCLTPKEANPAHVPILTSLLQRLTRWSIRLNCVVLVLYCAALENECNRWGEWALGSGLSESWYAMWGCWVPFTCCNTLTLWMETTRFHRPDCLPRTCQRGFRQQDQMLQLPQAWWALF